MILAMNKYQPLTRAWSHEKRLDIHVHLLWRFGHLGRFLRLRLTSAHNILVIPINRIVILAFSLRGTNPAESDGFALYPNVNKNHRIEGQRMTHLVLEIFTLPVLHLHL